ncbi:hypothetical protein [Salidesulfovibrio onnuriiensis]|uniref:hypothetical protein n=1 Tax=Salidesulfovibrio onnuriiensis TaxID=2583823 RepID=UPI0011C9BAE7|nr:hypothetical protein [Salidesulfovibrio onnuriiensis]
MINPIQSAYQTQTVDPVQRSRELAPKETAPASTGDRVDLSDMGKLVSRFFAKLGVDYTPGKAVTLVDLENGLERKQAELKDNVTALFLENGISTTPPVELTSDEEGHIRVKGDHPDKEKIEKLFEDNPDLGNDFRAVSALSSLVKAARESVEFSKEYEKNPAAAVAKYSHLFSSLGQDDFSMIFGGDTEEDAA